MQVKARSLRQPIADQLRFVCAVVIQNRMYIQMGWHVFFNRVEEAAKFHAPVAALRLSDQFP